MDVNKITEQILKNILNEGLHPTLLSQDQMIKMGATGALSKGYERYIPIDKIVGEDPSPKDWTDDTGEVNPFEKGGKINSSMEVIYDSGDDIYYLQNGNHRLKQAKINGDYYIRAFIEPDRGKIVDAKSRI